MKNVAVLASVAILIGSQALAADLPSRKVEPVAPVAPSFTWTGFYAGVNAGVDWASRNVNTAVNASELLSTWYPDLLQALSPTPYSNSRAGFIGGIQVGYNYQINQFVIGAEADFMGMAVSKRSGTSATSSSSVDISSFYGDPPGTDIFKTDASGAASTKITQNWLGTVRARAGFAIDRLLIFGTGGFAYGSVRAQTAGAVRFSQDVVFNDIAIVAPVLSGNLPSAGSKTSTQVGYTFGAGAEYAITDNWIIRAEYLYYNLGNITNVAAFGSSASGTVLEGVSVSSKTKVDGNIVRAAISYKF